MSTRSITPTVAPPVPAVTPRPETVLQRACDCGQHTIGGTECEECKKKKMPLQRSAESSGGPPVAPPIVRDVLGSPGQPLDDETRAFFEPRFGQNFSRVRVHRDAKAAESARAVNALAYTVGNNLVFGAGRYAPSTVGGRRLLAHELTHVVQQQRDEIPVVQHQLEVSAAQDRFEQEAVQVAERVLSGREANPEENLVPSASHTRPRLQRATADSAAASAEMKTTPSRSETALLVEDDTHDLKPGQMRKSEFLAKLQISICAAADEELKAVGRTTQACPYLARWMKHLASKDSPFVERGLRKYAPDVAGATKAEDYIPPVAARVRRGVARWAKTGEITEVPDELRGQLLAANEVGAVENVISGVGGALGGSAPKLPGGVRKTASGIGKVFAKERAGGIREAHGAEEIQSQLGEGRPLEASVRARMQTAFEQDFSRVRVHDDQRSSALSSRLNARAFAIGHDVAFGYGEYQPGTPVGDALIAHELAHVIQQTTDPGAIAQQAKSIADYNALEEDADQSAVGAVIRLWRGTKGSFWGLANDAMPNLRSGLRLQACKSESTDFQIRGKLNAPGETDKIYFDRNQATIDGVELAKFPAIITGHGVAANLALDGYRSEDESRSLAADRVRKVDQELGTARKTPPAHPAHTGTRVPRPLPDDSLGNPDYRSVRRVDIQSAGAGPVIAPPPPQQPPSCDTRPAWPCPAAPNAFDHAQKRAKDILDAAILKMGTPAVPPTRDLLRDLFGGTNPNPAARLATALAAAPGILTRLTNLRTHVIAMSAHHVCHKDCVDPGCGNRPAYNTGVGGASVTTLCGLMFEPSQTVDENAETLIHEGAHGTAGLATEDLAYSTERRFPFLPTAEAQRNTDSYVALARNLHTPGSVSIGPPVASKDVVAPGTMAAAEEFVAREAIAYLEKWLLIADFDTQILYDTVHRSIPPAPAWATASGDAFNRETMHEIAPSFGLTDPGTTAPFVQPTATDRIKLAAIHDRFLRMREAVYSRKLTLNKIAAGADAWTSGSGVPGTGPGAAVVLGPSFFALGGAIDRVRRLVQIIAAATPDVSGGIAGKYAEAADRMRKHRGVGP